MDYLIFAAAALILNSILTPLLIHVAHDRAWFDEINHRKIHTGEIPRIGGVGIFLSTILCSLAYLFFISGDVSSALGFIQKYVPFFTAIILVHILGLLDDFTNIRAKYKLFLQVFVSILIVVSGRYFTVILIPFTDYTIELSFFGPLLTILWFIGVINAINLIDGLDGLSSGITAIIFLFYGLIAVQFNHELGAVVSFIALGASLSFLFFNFPPAKIFMGDSGSLFLGVMLAILPFYTICPPDGSEGTGIALLASATLLIIPILDTLSAIIRRGRKNKPFYIPDQEHVHHKLLSLGFSNKSILAVVYAIGLIAAGAVYWWVTTQSILATAAVFAVWAATFCFFIYLHKRCAVQRGEETESAEKDNPSPHS